MRWALAIGVLWAACGSVVAAPTDRAEWNPPARFDRPYVGELTITRLPQKQVVEVCRYLFRRYQIPATAGYNQRGCAAITSPTTCTIITVDKPFRGTTPEAIIRHETGHCNKWPASHPD